MKHHSPSGRRLAEALYDLESGKTCVRHPEREDEWLECDLIEDVLKGRPMASVSGHDECEVFSTVPHGHRRMESRKLTLRFLLKGHHSELD